MALMTSPFFFFKDKVPSAGVKGVRYHARHKVYS